MLPWPPSPRCLVVAVLVASSALAGPASAQAPGRADYSGDGLDEIGVFRNGMWFLSHSPGYSGVDLSVPFGSPLGVDSPEIAELGCIAAGGGLPDGRADIAIFRRPSSTYQATLSPDYGAAPDLTATFGTTRHKRIPLRGFDTNGDGCSDIGVFRNGCFHVLESPGYGAIARTICFGLSTDIPVSGDLNADGVSDLGLWRPSSARFIFSLSPDWSGIDLDLGFGKPGDVPLLADVNGDEAADLGVYRKASSTFLFAFSPDFEGVDLVKTLGVAGDLPVLGEVNGDARVDLGVFRDGTSAWSFVCSPGYGSTCVSRSFGRPGDVLLLGVPDMPPATIYHGITTRSWGSWVTPPPGQADAIRTEVNAYEAAAGRTVAWVAFDHEWHEDGPAFRTDLATSVRDRGAVPLVYLTMRSIPDGGFDPIYNLEAILSGTFDADFAAWADAARAFGTQLVVDWGWEMNQQWVPWNGLYNGGPVDGPARFRETYRHIVELMRGRGANNIRWAFHVNAPEDPIEPWNMFESYYPGDDVVDMTGVSIYGAQTPTDDSFPEFAPRMDDAYPRLVAMAPQKPVFVFEFGATMGNPLGSPVTWADDALAGLLSGRWPSVRGFAWWNDAWQNDGDPSHDSEMRVEVVPGLATVFHSRLSGADNLGDRPPIPW